MAADMPPHMKIAEVDDVRLCCSKKHHYTTQRWNGPILVLFKGGGLREKLKKSWFTQSNISVNILVTHSTGLLQL